MPERHYDIAELVNAANAALSLLRMNASGDSNDAEIEAGHNCASVLRQFVEAVTADRPNVLYTRDQVSAAANDAANKVTDLWSYESSETIRIQSFIDLVVNATLSLLDDPDMSLDDVMNANWQVDDQECRECGGSVFQDDDDTWHHLDAMAPGHVPDADLDSDHTAIPDPADAAEMVRGWVAL